MVISLGAYLAILSALALERVFHLVIASRNARRAFAMGAVEHGRGHYPLMGAFHALFLIRPRPRRSCSSVRFRGRSDG